MERLLNGRYAIRNSVTATKDQTYALYNLTQEQLRHTLMPVGDYTKEEIRGIAQSIGLNVANKPDSMEICFVPDNDYAGFIARNTPADIAEGNFVDMNENVIGRHKGIIHYTVGQRKGLGIAMGHPVFVTEIRPESNEVVIGENKDILKKIVVCDNINYMSEQSVDENKAYRAKIRYNHPGAACRLKQEGESLHVLFETPVRAVTPGQALVVYDGEFVAMGGTIIGSGQ